MVLYESSLTLYANVYSRADPGWNSVRGDAQIGAHVQPADLHEVQHLAIHGVHWNIQERESND